MANARACQLFPNVVAWHGFAGAPASWAEVRKRLNHGSFSAPWLPGHGPNPLFAKQFEDAALLLSAGAPPGALLVGYSLGARLALTAALRQPERWSAVIAIGGNPGVDDRPGRQRWDEAQAAQIEADGVVAFARRWEQLPIFATQNLTQRKAQRAFREGHTVEGLAWAMRTLGQGRMPNLWTRLARWPSALPLTIIVGGDDQKYAAVGQRLARVVRHARLHRIGGVGHNPVVETPAAVASIIRRAV
ncbi:MAG: alpha/beta fold hydrolase [Myxococcota bacterium]